jgi:molecular chaperone GrpE
LKADEIETVLAEFRAWLFESGVVAPEPGEQCAELVDLHTLVAQFSALRQEVNLQTRAVRAQQEQTAQTLERYAESFRTLEAATEQVADARVEGLAEAVRPLLKGLIEAADAQGRALAELRRVEQSFEEFRKERSRREASAIAEKNDSPRLPILARLFGLGAVLAEVRKQLHDREEALEGDSAEALQRRVEAAASGLAMGLQRIERAIAECGLEAVMTVGQPFDAEQMEAIEVVTGSGRPPGEVVDEVRHGYRWNGRMFRFAQVRVAK